MNLILARKQRERVFLRSAKGDIVSVTIERIAGEKVELGIVADADTQIIREELNEDPALVQKIADMKRGRRRGVDGVKSNA